jgi:hypothetical protein
MEGSDISLSQWETGIILYKYVISWQHHLRDTVVDVNFNKKSDFKNKMHGKV